MQLPFSPRAAPPCEPSPESRKLGYCDPSAQVTFVATTGSNDEKYA